MTDRENYLAVINHEKAQSIPIYAKPARHSIGFMDEFEKGPPGGGLDGFGMPWIVNEMGPVPDERVHLITDITRWREQVTFPDLDAIDWAAKAEKDSAGFDSVNQVFEYGMGNGPFERLLDLMGYQELIYALLDEPEACHDFFDAYVEYRIKHIGLVARHYKHVDFITIYDDVAYQYGPFLTMETYREFIKPAHIRINRAIRDCGIIPINHCCGKAELLINDFIEEGAAAWTSLQPINDIVSLQKEYGDKMVFIGGFDGNGRPGLIGTPDEERVAELHRAINTYGPHGSFILGNMVVAGGTRAETLRINEHLASVAYELCKNYYI